jgi:hypothetical protein
VQSAECRVQSAECSRSKGQSVKRSVGQKVSRSKVSRSKGQVKSSVSQKVSRSKGLVPVSNGLPVPVMFIPCFLSRILKKCQINGMLSPLEAKIMNLYSKFQLKWTNGIGGVGI